MLVYPAGRARVNIQNNAKTLHLAEKITGLTTALMRREFCWGNDGACFSACASLAILVSERSIFFLGSAEI